ncbi:doublesex isoform X3 [Cardiocondyla obscurior]|uniref:doublesex isoform X3 n=1 Tax=Cardiocondyla obscurior TaxID=286306 RepID=UPI003965745B
MKKAIKNAISCWTNSSCLEASDKEKKYLLEDFESVAEVSVDTKYSKSTPVDSKSSKSSVGNSKSSKKYQPYQRTPPKCGRCHVHGVNVDLRGHKRYCKYQDCYCPKCYIFLQEQKNSAAKIAMKRAFDLNQTKKMSPEEVLPSSLVSYPKKKSNLRILIDFIWKEMNEFASVWYNPGKIYHIFAILNRYSSDLRLNDDIYLDYIKLIEAKTWIHRVIHEEDIHLFMMTYYYNSSSMVVRTSEERQSIGVPSSPFQNLSVPLNTLATFPIPDLLKPGADRPTEPFQLPDLVKPPTKSSSEPSAGPFIDPGANFSPEPFIDPGTDSSAEPFIDPGIDSSTEPSTNHSTESSAESSYYW